MYKCPKCETELTSLPEHDKFDYRCDECYSCYYEYEVTFSKASEHSRIKTWNLHSR